MTAPVLVPKGFSLREVRDALVELCAISAAVLLLQGVSCGMWALW